MGLRTFMAAAPLLLIPAMMLQAAEPRPAARAASTRKTAPARKPAPAKSAVFAGEVLPVMRKYCFGCHGPSQQLAGVGLHTYPDEASVVKGRALWQKVMESLRSHHMPPKNAPQPAPGERAAAAARIDAILTAADCGVRDPGRVTMRRLNRAEYDNTIRDLFGLDLKPSADFPSDDVGYGFDNIGDVLTISPILMEKYLTAAERIVNRALVFPEPAVERFEAERPQETQGEGTLLQTVRALFSNGEVRVVRTGMPAGEYLLRARAYQQRAGDEAARMAFRVDGQEVGAVSVSATESQPEVFEQKVTLAAGTHRLAVAFTNDFYVPRSQNNRGQDRNLYVDYLEVVGPLGVKPGALPESHRRILFRPIDPEKPLEGAREILHRFARRAYRRPVSAQEVDRLLRIVDLGLKEGDSVERAVAQALTAVLVSPGFLFRVETDAAPNDPRKIRALNDWELASRLSYFLWSSMPDDTLFDLAAKKQLQKPEVLEAQARRMLKDPKASALVQNFGLQWLTLGNLQNANPDPRRFPGFTPELRQAMRKETELFFTEVAREDRSILDFLDGRFTYLNGPLARHYGIPGVEGQEFRRVVLPAGPRLGVLTQASILTITSNPTRTSPVKRGKWVLEQILGTPPPPALPDVPVLADDKGGPLTGTLRQRMEQHRKDPNCATCHARMDAIGFSFENFDAVGAWRTQDGQEPIDASGEMPDGQKFQGPAELIAILKQQKDGFARNFVSQMLTYALGRGLEHYDRCVVDEVAQTVGKRGYRFSAVVVEIVKSEPFRKRRGDDGGS